jgi:hypothetical protein
LVGCFFVLPISSEYDKEFPKILPAAARCDLLQQGDGEGGILSNKSNPRIISMALFPQHSCGKLCVAGALQVDEAVSVET